LLRSNRTSIIIIILALGVVPFLPLKNEVVGQSAPVIFDTATPPNPSYKGHFLMASVLSGPEGFFGPKYTLDTVKVAASDADSLSRVASWRAAYHDATVFITRGTKASLPPATVPLIEILTKDSPAKKAGLQGGDTVLSVNDIPAPSQDQLTAIEKTAKQLTITVSRDSTGKSITRTLLPITGVAQNPYGFNIQEAFPADPEYDTANKNFGGPSAGLMTFLADLDARISGDLSGGKIIAGTGAIDGSGVVYPIGAVAYKVAAILKTRAAVFFVPTANYADALTAASGSTKLTVVPVATEQDAVNWLCSHGGTAKGICNR